MGSSKQSELVEALIGASRPLSGEELAARLHVSTRSVRNYVRELNRHSLVVKADHHGYRLDRAAYAKRQELVGRRPGADTPGSRLTYLCRSLTQASRPKSVFELADALHVSDSTIEADLGRVRELFRHHDLVLRRDGEFVSLIGTERARRRLLRQVLFNDSDGLNPATWRALTEEYQEVDVPALREAVSEIVADSALELNEFALSDVVLHLTVTVDQVRRGHTLPVTSRMSGPAEPAIAEVTDQLAVAVQVLCQVVLPPSELDSLYNMLAVRAVLMSGEKAAEEVIDADVRLLVSEIMEETSAKYLLGPAEPEALINLSLHVQNLLARVRSGVPYSHPLGGNFRTSHPLLHDLALDFADRLERRTGEVVALGELSFLALHMGMQYLQYLEHRDLVTITLVVPQYYDLGDKLADSLSDKLRGKAMIETVAAGLDFDFSKVTSDLIVSTIDPGRATAAPTILISPLLSDRDLKAITEAVTHERERTIRLRIRSMLETLIDPSLFIHVDALPSKEAALGLLTDRLAAAGYVDSGFLDDVLDRERRSSTAFGGQFAIPHSMHMDANGTAIAPLVSDKGIPWGSSQVRLVFLFALSPDGRHIFRDVLDEVIGLLSDARNVAVLTDAGGDADSFRRALLTLLERHD